ncbi:MAG: ABC transporter ATP-binding protein [Granulosicoccus sp.]
MATLSISGLQKYYGKSHALRGIDLDIPEGEFTVFVGPSGCGKSTLLRTIAGLEQIDGGTISIDGDVINDMRPRDRDLAMVFQNYALYPYMNVFENIAFGLRARKSPKENIAPKVNAVAKMLDIEPLLQRFPKELSGGQRQRVAIGRAVVRNARLFLFDEPLSNLDAQLREGMRSEIKRLHQEIGKTMIYVTHDQVEAMTLADRIVLLRDGVIEQVGAPLELFEKPVSRFVAAFVGSPTINFVPATLLLENNRIFVRFTDGRQVQVPSSRLDRLDKHIDRQITCGIRAEHIQRTDDDGLKVRIELLQPTGSRSFATFRLSDVPVVAELEAHDGSCVDDRITITIDTKRMLLIDPNTDKVL